MPTRLTTRLVPGRRSRLARGPLQLPWLRPPGLALFAALLAGIVHAATAAAQEAQAAQAERAACERLAEDDARASCLRELAAARAEARRGGLDDGAADYRANALVRCERLPPDDRRDCIARITGAGTVSGSVEGGGLLREYRRIEILPAGGERR